MGTNSAETFRRCTASFAWCSTCNTGGGPAHTIDLPVEAKHRTHLGQRYDRGHRTTPAHGDMRDRHMQGAGLVARTMACRSRAASTVPFVSSCRCCPSIHPPTAGCSICSKARERESCACVPQRLGLTLTLTRRLRSYMPLHNRASAGVPIVDIRPCMQAYNILPG